MAASGRQPSLFQDVHLPLPPSTSECTPLLCAQEVEAGRKDLREYEERLRKAQTRLREHGQEVGMLRQVGP